MLPDVTPPHTSLTNSGRPKTDEVDAPTSISDLPKLEIGCSVDASDRELSERAAQAHGVREFTITRSGKRKRQYARVKWRRASVSLH